jgi:hypothetical protein
MRQYAQYGYWKIEVMRKHGKVPAPRHLVPGAFVLALPVAALTVVPLMAYGALLGTLAVQTFKKEKDPVLAVETAFAASLLHLGYGLGTLAGVLAPPQRGGRLARAMQKLTR